MLDVFKCSVSITTYNMEKYIARSIESVLSQKTNFAYEIIVADDCSTDNTIAILQYYQQKLGEKLVILYSEKNRSVVENFSKTLWQTKTKYLSLLDADDYWTEENKLQIQIDLLETNNDIGFVYTNYQHISENGKNIATIEDKFINPKKNAFETYLLYPYICPSTICFRRTLIDFNLIDNFIKKQFYSQDYSLFLDFTSKSKGYYIDKIFVNNTIRSNSLSRQADMVKHIAYLQNCYKIGNYFIVKHPISSSLEKKRNFLHHQSVLLAAWASRDFNFVRQYTQDLHLRDFLKYNPKAAYIFIASKNKFLYRLFIPWVLRKRKFR